MKQLDFLYINFNTKLFQNHESNDHMNGSEKKNNNETEIFTDINEI